MPRQLRSLSTNASSTPLSLSTNASSTPLSLDQCLVNSALSRPMPRQLRSLSLSINSSSTPLSLFPSQLRARSLSLSRLLTDNLVNSVSLQALNWFLVNSANSLNQFLVKSVLCDNQFLVKFALSWGPRALSLSLALLPHQRNSQATIENLSFFRVIIWETLKTLIYIL
jgi:hypothetical protein